MLTWLLLPAQMVPGLGEWASDVERRLFISGRLNHWIHARLGQLELSLLKQYMQENGREEEPLPQGAEAERIVKQMMPQSADIMIADGHFSTTMDSVRINSRGPQLSRLITAPVFVCLVFWCSVQTRRCCSASTCP